jgi:hypothetical protein
MTDEEIRAAIRAAIAKHLGPSATEPRPPSGSPPSHPPLAFHRYPIPRAPGDVMCLIEPAVACTHCGYCECHGH